MSDEGDLRESLARCQRSQRMWRERCQHLADALDVAEGRLGRQLRAFRALRTFARRQVESQRMWRQLAEDRLAIINALVEGMNRADRA